MLGGHLGGNNFEVGHTKKNWLVNDSFISILKNKIWQKRRKLKPEFMSPWPDSNIYSNSRVFTFRSNLFLHQYFLFFSSFFFGILRTVTVASARTLQQEISWSILEKFEASEPLSFLFFFKRKIKKYSLQEMMSNQIIVQHFVPSCIWYHSNNHD